MDKYTQIVHCIQKLSLSQNLTYAEAENLMEAFIEGNFTHAQLGCLMMGLRLKGETTEELLGFLGRVAKI